MARQAVTSRQLVKIEGMDEVLKNLGNLMSRSTGDALKTVYVDGAKEIWAEAKRNIRSLPVSDKAKQVLDAENIINQAEPRRPYVIAGMSQQAGIKKLGIHGRFIPNPYWFEFGTKNGMRPTPFFRPAVAMVKGRVAAALERGFKKIVEGATR